MSSTVEATKETCNAKLTLTNNDALTKLDKPKSDPLKKPKKTKAKDSKTYSTKPGHVDGKMWVWGDGKLTSMKFLHEAMMRKRPLPPGFYQAFENSPNPSHKLMATIARERGIKELK